MDSPVFYQGLDGCDVVVLFGGFQGSRPVLVTLVSHSWRYEKDIKCRQHTKWTILLFPLNRFAYSVAKKTLPHLL